MLASASTLIPFLLVEALVLAYGYAGYVIVSEELVHWRFDINLTTVLLTLLACDFVYYWEHRFAHQIRILWTQHAVHHSSRFMNIVVGVRFGPAEGAVSLLMNLPLVLLGFPPSLVFFGVLAVFGVSELDPYGVD